MSADPRELESLERTETAARGARPGDGKTRRFVGASLREVYARVRAELGADAMILEQRTRDGRVEVLAGHDDAARQAGRARERVSARLRELGFSAAVVAALPANVRSLGDVERALGRVAPCAPPAMPMCGRYRLLGPPGVGKTTALIKLMASRVLRYGNLGTVLISTDRSRLAGSEQLASSAELLGVEFVECSEQSLPETLARWRHMQLVLIDSAGIRGGRVAAPVDDVEDLLAVPAMWQEAALRRLAGQFEDHPMAGVVLTHTDQAESLAVCANVLADWQWPVWWIGHGGEVAAELEPADEFTLGRALLGRFDRSAVAAMFAR